MADLIKNITNLKIIYDDLKIKLDFDVLNDCVITKDSIFKLSCELTKMINEPELKSLMNRTIYSLATKRATEVDNILIFRDGINYQIEMYK